jgi:hypothetical protein
VAGDTLRAPPVFGETPVLIENGLRDSVIKEHGQHAGQGQGSALTPEALDSMLQNTPKPANAQITRTEVAKGPRWQ